MARYRPIPKCPYCGKEIAKPIHKNTDGTFIGDTFIRWETIPHSCKGKRKADKEMKAAIDESMAKIKADAKKTGRKLPPFFK